MILQTTENQKYLGLVFDNCQSLMGLHVSNVCKKMSYHLHLINTHNKVLNCCIIKLLVDSLVFSHLTQVMLQAVWGSSINQQSAQRLEHLQNRAVRLLHHFDHVTEYYCWVKRSPFSKLRSYVSFFMFKVFHYHQD